jgi:hypothetical protein
VEEENQQGEAKDELASKRQMAEGYKRAGLPAESEMRWSSRPSGSWYCGTDEFDDTYYIGEIRNGGDFECAFYETHGDTHTCDTCAHRRKTSERILRTLKETLLAGGTQGQGVLTGEVQPALRAQAIDEYQSCVDNAGFVLAPPTFLPYCAACSSDPEHNGNGTFVVGPVMNSDARCTRWQPRTDPDDPPDTELEALLRHAERLKEFAASIQFSFAPGTPSWIDVNRAEYSARANIIAYCLRKLLTTEDFIVTVCNSFTYKAGATEWRQDPFTGAEFLPENQVQTTAAGAPAGAPTGPTRQQEATVVPIPELAGRVSSLRQRLSGRRRKPCPPAPDAANGFLALPGVRYTHPAHPEVALTIINAAPRVIAVVESPTERREYDLSSFPWNMWTELRGQATGVWIAVYVQLPVAVYVNW